ncbi:Bug family tripartite tricarboxylate transporter substrate binding protein [Sabulicella glaciei]|uniref:Tripartite tricarboxylate transporter substrate binding protein n=1 Tax=Sabulicella glaciei TaxID=2984948 RepID=A0ABT3P0M8_9PROT|nr:tripartite tricarboxylate transporter substrate binding protein [Roseococcus sp. MDT2-1-1]MCW8087951.1 tripartite tricarboxylate transporter substrate binding protein [Roseococcus sp. MDT2-1-1]
MRSTRRAALLLPLAMPALAQQPEWPSRPIRFVVPYPPGGPTDLVGRVAAAAMPVPTVVENRAGGSGSIGAGEVARATPDGTVFMVNASAHVIVPHLQPNLPYDALADFTPVTELVKVPLVAVVPSASPIRDIAGLIEAARARPGRLTYASSSIGGAPHLAGELFKLLARVDLTHVPYRGSGPALTDLLGGTVDVMFDSLASSAGHVREGRLRAIAVSTAARLPETPDLPTVAEAGVPGYEIATWYGLWGPPRLPDAVAKRMRDALAQGMAQPEASGRLAAMGAIPILSEPAEYARFVRSESDRWGQLVRDAGIRAE